MTSEIRQMIYEYTFSFPPMSANNVFYGEAPQQTTQDPYVVISQISDVPSRDTEQEFEEITIQFNITSETYATAESLEQVIVDAWQASGVETTLNDFYSLIDWTITNVILVDRADLKFDHGWQTVVRIQISMKRK